MYADIEYYNSLYDEIDAQTYNRHGWHAAKLLDKYTTGVDGVRKLQKAFPSDLDAQEAVKRCECALVNLLLQIEQAEKAGAASTRADGTVVSGAVSSVSSGAESISYAAGNTAINAAAADNSARERLISSTVREYLSAEKDANGVNLLYMGVYPYVL